jgi:hypothetical protein
MVETSCHNMTRQKTYQIYFWKVQTELDLFTLVRPVCSTGQTSLAWLKDLETFKSQNFFIRGFSKQDMEIYLLNEPYLVVQ